MEDADLLRKRTCRLRFRCRNSDVYNIQSSIFILVFFKFGGLQDSNSSFSRNVSLLDTPLKKRLQPSLCSAQYKSVNIVSTFIGVNRFEIHHVADNTVFV